MMKSTTILMVLMCLVASCSETSDIEQSTEKNKEIRVDTLILGFTFNMTKSEFTSHLWELKQEGKVSKKNAYKFDFGPNNQLGRYALAYFRPRYENNKLWQLTLIIEGKTEYDIPVAVFSNLQDMYKEKYGSFEYGEAYDGFESTWTFSNMEIVLVMTDYDCMVTYTDLERKRQFEDTPIDTSDL